jgi:hypothetical protein
MELQQGLCTRIISFGIFGLELYPHSVPGVWRAESRGSFEGDVHNLCVLCVTASPRVTGAPRDKESHPQWNFRTKC